LTITIISHLVERFTYSSKVGNWWGYYKKLVIADNLAVYVDKVYNKLGYYQGFALVLATFFFTLQIYCDFSGYSDIAIGTAKLFGINLMENFRTPYFARTVKEFWKRWHISLSIWFKDYVYIPLGGNRCTIIRHNINLMVTFLISGLWHGANWTYILWGGIHGIAQILENIFRTSFEKFRKNYFGEFISWFAVFAFCNMAWIFFRAQSLPDVIYIFKNMFSGLTSPVAYLRDGFNDIGIPVKRLIWLSALILILAVVDWLSLNGDVPGKIKNKNIVVRWLLYAILTLLVIFFSQKGVAAEFVYFQF